MKTHRIVTVAMVLASILSISSCVTAQKEVTIFVKFYNLDTGSVFQASSKEYVGTGYSEMSMITDKGVRCSGESSTQAGGYSGTSVGTSRGWGSIYGWGAGGFTGVRSSARSTESYSLSPNDQVGSVVLSCDDKNIIQCEYVVNKHYGHGTGYCTDSKNVRYRITF